MALDYPLDISSGSAQFIIHVPGLGLPPQKIVGFTPENMFSLGDIQTADQEKGLDGRSFAYKLQTVKEQTVSLEPNSPSFLFFTRWFDAQEALLQTITASSGLVFLPAIGRTIELELGTLVRGKPLPDAKKRLMNVDWVIKWSVARGF